MLAGVETAPAFPPLTSGPQHFTVPEVSNFPGLRPAVPKEGMNGSCDPSFGSLIRGGPTGYCLTPIVCLEYSLSVTP